MKRLLPLLFLVPSLALIIYAKRDAQDGGEVVHVRIEMGNFTFPGDVRLVVLEDGALLAKIEAGWADCEADSEEVRTLQLACVLLEHDESEWTPVPIGEPQDVDFEVSNGDVPPLLSVTPDQCRVALAALRKNG